MSQQLKIPLREQAKAHEYIKTHGYQTKIFLRPSLDFKAYAEGANLSDSVETQCLELKDIAIQISESVAELLILFDDVHKHVQDAFGHLSSPGPDNLEHLKHKHILTGETLMQMIRRYEDFKYKRGI